MPTYNGEKYIREQIESILPQLSDIDELIISDDSSSDNTLGIVKSFNDCRIKIFQGHFHSPIFNLENALKNAKGDYIYTADQDDVWKPNKVSVVQKYLENYDCVVSDAVVVDLNRNVINDSFFKLRKSRPGKIWNLIHNSYLGCCMAFNKRILDIALPFPKDIPMHDIWIGAVADNFGKPVFIKDKLIEYRRHGNNASPAAEKSRYSLIDKIRFRMAIVMNIGKRKNECK